MLLLIIVLLLIFGAWRWLLRLRSMGFSRRRWYRSWRDFADPACRLYAGRPAHLRRPGKPYSINPRLIWTAESLDGPVNSNSPLIYV